MRKRTRRAYFIRDTITILVLLAAIVVICVGKGWLESHTPQVIAGLSLVASICLVGVIVAAFLAGPKA